MTKTQKNNQHRIPPHKRPFIVAIVLILLIVVAAVVVVILVNSRKSAEPDAAPLNSNQPLGSQSGQAPAATTPDSPNPKPTQYEGDDPNELNELTGSIPYQDVSGGILSISTMIDQYLTEDGTCEIALTGSNGYTYTDSVAAIADVTTSICEPFNINTANFPSDTYQIKIKITGDGKSGIVTGEVQL